MTDKQALARLRWRCRRGMRELDVLFERYLDRRYPQAPLHEQQAFVALLDLQDPQLFAWLLRREIPTDPQLADVVDQLTRLLTDTASPGSHAGAAACAQVSGEPGRSDA